MRNNPKKKIVIAICMLSLILLTSSISCFALSDDEIKNVLLKNSDYFVMNDIIHDCLYTIGWGLVKFLVFFCNLAMVLYQKTLGLIDFTTWDVTEQWLSTFTLVLKSILALSLGYMGISLIVGKKKKPPVFKAVILYGFTILGLFSCMEMAERGIYALNMEIVGDATSNTAQIVSENMVDLVYVDMKKGINTFDSTNKDYMAECRYSSLSRLDVIDITETVNFKSSLLRSESQGQNGIFGKSLLFNGSISDDMTNIANYTLTDIYSGFGWNDGDDNDFFNTFYYRYHVNYFSIYIQLLATTLVYFFMSYKVARLIYELSLKRIISVLYSADFNATEKTLKILSSIKDGYIVLVVTALLIKLFQLAQLYLAITFSNDKAVGNIILLFITIAVIDGPNIIQEVTGIDAGLSSISNHMIAAWQLSSAATHGVSRAGSGITNAAGHLKDKLKSQGQNFAENAKNNLDLQNHEKEMPKEGVSASKNQNQDVNSNLNNQNMDEQMNKDLSEQHNSNLDEVSAESQNETEQKQDLQNAADPMSEHSNANLDKQTAKANQTIDPAMPPKDNLDKNALDKNTRPDDTFKSLNDNLSKDRDQYYQNLEDNKKAYDISLANDLNYGVDQNYTDGMEKVTSTPKSEVAKHEDNERNQV